MELAIEINSAKDLAELKTIPKLNTLYIHEFFINKKIKIDRKNELLKIIADLKQIDEIILTINGESYIRTELLAELKKIEKQLWDF